VSCEQREDIEELYELACKLSLLVEHTPFKAFVDDEYDDEVYEPQP
jgi:hypothetical protein